MSLPFLPSEQQSILPNQLKVSPSTQCREMEIETEIELRGEKQKMCVPMQESVMGSKSNNINVEIKEVKLQWNDKIMAFGMMSFVPFCTFKKKKKWNQEDTVDWSLFVGLSDKGGTLTNAASYLKSDNRPPDIPSPFISSPSGSAGAGHCCDITIGLYHPSKFKCLWEAFNILLIRIAECSTIIHSS